MSVLNQDLEIEHRQLHQFCLVRFIGTTVDIPGCVRVASKCCNRYDCITSFVGHIDNWPKMVWHHNSLLERCWNRPRAVSLHTYSSRAQPQGKQANVIPKSVKLR